MEKQLSVHENAEAYEIDISLVRANLRLTPTERLADGGVDFVG